LPLLDKKHSWKQDKMKNSKINETNINQNRLIESKQFVLQGEEFLRLCQAVGRVTIFKQTECPESEKYAMCFDETDFWVDCFATKKEATQKAKTLGLKT
jgi:hypothetical protein